MSCSECKDLRRAFTGSQARYLEARQAAFYRVSTELAAKRQVDMERAKSDLQEHEEVCLSAAALTAAAEPADIDPRPGLALGRPGNVAELCELLGQIQQRGCVVQ